ncbi:MAG: exo-alpha-sialidase [Hyphomicrobiaceae bacterium]|nr:MAG: exo-alpha-sialidase [Hyphomicrobiaceae bacterium]
MKKTAAALFLLCFSACGYHPLGPPPAAGPFLVARGGERRFPFAFDVPGGGVVVSHSTHKDDYLAAASAETTRLGHLPQNVADFYLSGVVPVGDGLYGASYTTYDRESSGGVFTEEVRGWFSWDGGVTWAPRPGTLRLPEAPIQRAAGWGGILMHRRLHAMGPLIAGTAYGGYARDARPGGGEWYRSVWVESGDGGLSWTVRSTIAEGRAGTEGYAEPVSAICPGGPILVVMRTGPLEPMRWTRSNDRGQSWSRSLDMPGMIGWDPDLLASPSEGRVYLSWGRAGAFHVAYTEDCGGSWRRVAEREVNTSGYTGLALNGGLTVFADLARETEIWGFPVGESP